MKNWLLALALAPAAALAGDQAAQVFNSASPSVYSIIATTNTGKTMLGSGVVVMQGRIVTNHHVIDGADRIQVKHGDEQAEAVLESSDKAHDLALLQVPGIRGTPATFGEVKGTRIGQTVYAIGSPRGLELSLSEGLISSMRSTPDGNMIQTTAAISPGSSGGGLFDERGRLLGFTTAQVIDGQNLNFAVPVEWLRFVGITAQATPIAGFTNTTPTQRALPTTALESAPAPARAETLAPESLAVTTVTPAQAREAMKHPGKSPNLYVATALILILLVAAKPAINWLSEYMASDDLPAPPPVARTARPITPIKDKLAAFREQPRAEIKSGQREADIWLQALEQNGGDESRATVAYIELRAQALYRADMDKRWAEAQATSVHKVPLQPRG